MRQQTVTNELEQLKNNYRKPLHSKRIVFLRQTTRDRKWVGHAPDCVLISAVHNVTVATTGGCDLHRLARTGLMPWLTFSVK